jgi:RNA polymerase sigma-70 factor, ECF subfamily
VSVVDVREAITRAHHEEAAADAFATAVARWPVDGVPPTPAPG